MLLSRARFAYVAYVVVALGFRPPERLFAQTAADSAAVLLDAARGLEREGRAAASRELLRYIGRRYPATTAALAADSLLRALPQLATTSTGHTGYVLFNTVYGAFLGAAIPAAFGAESAAPYGAGLLVGAPLGFLASRAYARAKIRTGGQAGIATLATYWGTWQGVGWQQVFNIGEEEVCGDGFCYTQTSDRAPWAAMVVGGLAGLGVGLATATGKDIPSGTSTMVSASALWTSWFGLAGAIIGGAEDDDDILAAVLLSGNVGLLAGIPAARAWRPSSSRVRLISAAGLAGALAGFGIDLLAEVDDDATAFAIPAVASAIGLIASARATRDRDEPDGAGGSAPVSGALLELRDGLRLGMPLPQPQLAKLRDHEGRQRTRAGVRLDLLRASF